MILVVTATAGDRAMGLEGSGLVPVFLDFDTVLLATFQGRRGLELGLQADLLQSIERFSEIADDIVVVIDPPPTGGGHALETEHRLEVLRQGLGEAVENLIVVACPHGESGACDCAKPGTGLIEIARADHGVANTGGWYICGDQEGVVRGRTAGLRTIRVGPAGEDHLSAVHRADYDARDLHDAANRIMVEELVA